MSHWKSTISIISLGDIIIITFKIITITNCSFVSMIGIRTYVVNYFTKTAKPDVQHKFQLFWWCDVCTYEQYSWNMIKIIAL